MRLKCLSQQPDIVLDTPCFVLQTSSSERNITRNQVATQVEVAEVFPISSVQSVALPLSASSKVEQMSILGMSLPDRSKEVSSLNSGKHLNNMKICWTVITVESLYVIRIFDIIFLSLYCKSLLTKENVIQEKKIVKY